MKFTPPPCDTVQIHSSAAPYTEVVQPSNRGLPLKSIRVVGVPGLNGELPALDGAGAVEPNTLAYTNPVFDNLGMLLVLPPTGRERYTATSPATSKSRTWKSATRASATPWSTGRGRPPSGTVLAAASTSSGPNTW
ncbi:hypothetical protein [Deinococcus hopiensis]|uniref:hypothetical protein n=1 Tax=Deinococcus hopiensis TaxID=309885 RepID=UPI00111BF34C|nr:hypothetical protein [Deinococcus hopiensis]